jgi:hypothetical protein
MRIADVDSGLSLATAVLLGVAPAALEVYA